MRSAGMVWARRTDPSPALLRQAPSLLGEGCSSGVVLAACRPPPTFGSSRGPIEQVPRYVFDALWPSAYCLVPTAYCLPLPY